MQNVSDAVLALLASYAKVTLTAYIDGEPLDAAIDSGEYTPSCGSADVFSIGNACAAGWKMTIAAARPDLTDHRIYMTWSVDGTEYPLFTGQVSKVKVSAGRTTVEAWDDMYYGGSKPYAPTEDACTAAAAFSGIAEAMGISAEPETLEALSGIYVTGLAALSGDLSNSAVAGHIAGLLGGNAVMTRSGQLAIRLFAETGWHTECYSGDANAENSDFAVTGLTLQRETVASSQNADGTSCEASETEEYGAGDGTLMISNPLADQDAADRAYTALEGLTFRPGTYSFPVGLSLEPGDIFTVQTMDGSYSVAAVSITMSIDGGVKTSVSCGGSDETGGCVGQINQALKALTADFARLRKLVADNATIVSAKITNLSADDITAGRIHSTDYATVELDEIYPGEDVYPSDTLYPNNGEEIIRGFEIDFGSGTIRGVFYSSVIDDLSERLDALEARVAAIDQS